MAIADPKQSEVAQSLQPTAAALSLRGYLRALWGRRDFALYVPRGALRAQNMDTFLGNLWQLLNPALQIAVYYMVFGVILGIDRGIENYIAFLTVGLLVYQFSRKTAQTGTGAITKNAGLIRSLAFPRALLPITTSATELLAFVPALFVMFSVLLITGELPNVAWLAVIVLVFGQFLMNLGMAFITARLTRIVPDFDNLLPFIFRLIFYLSGILFSVAVLLEDNEPSNAQMWGRLVALNPFYAYPSLYRWATMDGQQPPAAGWVVASAAIWSVGLLVGGFLWFRRGEASYGSS